MLDNKDDNRGVKCPYCHYGKWDTDHSCKVCDGHGTATPESANKYLREWAEWKLEQIHKYAEIYRKRKEEEENQK